MGANPLFILILGLQVAFPAGAVLFRSRRRKLIVAHRPLMPADQLPTVYQAPTHRAKGNS
jgi:hypothetical protein